MCTVSVVPLQDSVICTFNRDEQVSRKTDEFICQEHHSHKQILFSKDRLSGGTWFSADDQGHVAMLFNGGFAKHERQQSYRKSRGKVLLEMIGAASPIGYFRESDFEGLEPFSIILISLQSISRLTWDGTQKHHLLLDKSRAHFFSSATLYSPSSMLERQNWFNGFAANRTAVITPESIFSFHRTHQEQDSENGLVIKRSSGVSTLSISQAILSAGLTRLIHFDILSEKSYQSEISHT